MLSLEGNAWYIELLQCPTLHIPTDIWCPNGTGFLVWARLVGFLQNGHYLMLACEIGDICIWTNNEAEQIWSTMFDQRNQKSFRSSIDQAWINKKKGKIHDNIELMHLRWYETWSVHELVWKFCISSSSSKQGWLKLLKSSSICQTNNRFPLLWGPCCDLAKPNWQCLVNPFWI